MRWRAGQTLARADYGALTVREGALAVAPPIDLRRWLLPAALIGLLIDALISAWLAGGAAFRRRRRRSRPWPLRSRSALCRRRIRAAPPKPARSDMDAALSARLAYVADRRQRLSTKRRGRGSPA